MTSEIFTSSTPDKMPNLVPSVPSYKWSHDVHISEPGSYDPRGWMMKGYKNCSRVPKNSFKEAKYYKKLFIDH